MLPLFHHQFFAFTLDYLNSIPIIACNNVDIFLIFWRKFLPVKWESPLFYLLAALLLLKNHLMTEQWFCRHSGGSTRSRWLTKLSKSSKYIYKYISILCKKHSFQDQYILSPFCHLHNPQNYVANFLNLWYYSIK